MNTRLKNILEYIRIIRVLAWKDVWDALKNRNILVLIFSVGLLIVFYKALPSLAGGDESPRVLVYDAGQSALTALLEDDPNLTAQTQFESKDAMFDRMRDWDTPELGLVIPADFDHSMEAGQIPELQGYVMYWLDQEEALALKDAVASEISRQAGKPVSISIEGNTVFGVPEKDGAGGQASMAIIFALMMIGITLVPNILLDEKQARTLDVLMVSPASETQIAAAKALAGLFYTGVVAGLALAINYRLVMHWGLAIAAILLFGLLAVLLGLILGTCMETRAQFQLWSWVLILPMILPMILYLISDLLPEFLVKILPVFPSATMLILLRYAYATPIFWGVPLLGIAWLLVWVIVELGIVSWLLRRRDRADKPIAAANGLRVSVRQRKESSEPLPSAARPALLSIRREAYGPAPTSGPRLSLRIIGAVVSKDLREDCQVRFVRSRAELDETVLKSFGTWVGIVVPADFDQRAGAIDLEAEIAHWADMARVDRSIAFFETQLDSAGPAPVRIQVAEKRLYPSVETSGVSLLNLFTQILVMITIGFVLVPLLLVEEKESRTMDMLMTSPAGWLQLLAGKALAGLAYCLCAGLVILLVNLRLIVHWDIMILALLLTSGFVVSVGLLIGALANTPTTAAFWGSPLMLLMVASAIMKIFPGVVLPAWLDTALAGSPAWIILRLFRLALAGEAPAQMVWGAAAALSGMAAAVYIVVIIIMRKKYSV